MRRAPSSDAVPLSRFQTRCLLVALLSSSAEPSSTVDITSVLSNCSKLFSVEEIHSVGTINSASVSSDLKALYKSVIMPPPRRGWVGALSGHRRLSSVRLSDVAYIGSNSKTKRPRKTKLCTGVPQVTCDSTPTSRSKGQKSRSRGGGILWRPPIAAQLVIVILYQDEVVPLL